MKYFSMFSGIGGFELGIQRAYDNRGLLQSKTAKSLQKDSSDIESRQIRPSCIGYSEIDKYACQIYDKHFNHKNYGDCTTINEKELPDFDLLVGGFPCQAFSIAGKRQGFDDTRGTLFFDIARIVREKQPRLLLLENVKGLLSHDKGQTFYTIISTLDELGYDCQWQVLNSKNFGVPQNRERVFIIGHLRGTSRPEVFPFGERSQGINETNGKTSQTNISRTVDSRTGSYPKWGQYIKQLNQPTHSNDRVYGTDGVSPTLNTAQGGNRQPFIKAVLTPNRPIKRQNGRRIKEDGEPSFTLTGQDQHGVMIVDKKGKKKNKDYASTLTGGGHSGGNHSDMDLIKKDTKIRRLTPVECERLQGFPDGWTEGLSDTQRYKTLGNAVTVNVVREIIKRLI